MLYTLRSNTDQASRLCNWSRLCPLACVLPRSLTFLMWRKLYSVGYVQQSVNQCDHRARWPAKHCHNTRLGWARQVFASHLLHHGGVYLKRKIHLTWSQFQNCHIKVALCLVELNVCAINILFLPVDYYFHLVSFHLYKSSSTGEPHLKTTS